MRVTGGTVPSLPSTSITAQPNPVDPLIRHTGASLRSDTLAATTSSCFLMCSWAGKRRPAQYGGGAGWTFRRHESNQVSLMGSMVRSMSEFRFKPDETRADIRVDDPLFVAAVSWDKTLRHKITTKVLLYYFKPATGGGNHAMAADASAKIPIVGPLYFTMHVYATPELRQRQLFSIKNLQVSSGFGVEF